MHLQPQISTYTVELLKKKLRNESDAMLRETRAWMGQCGQCDDATDSTTKYRSEHYRNVRLQLEED